MDTVTQVDLSRDEAPPAQVLDSTIGAAIPPSGGGIPDANAALTAAHDQKKQRTISVRGASALTSTYRLNTKTLSKPDALDDEDQEVQQLLAIDDTEAVNNVSVLPTVDQGFGAWSYVAGAFAMNVAVWGWYDLKATPNLKLTAAQAFRDPISSSRRFCQLDRNPDFQILQS